MLISLWAVPSTHSFFPGFSPFSTPDRGLTPWDCPHTGQPLVTMVIASPEEAAGAILNFPRTLTEIRQSHRIILISYLGWLMFLLDFAVVSAPETQAKGSNRGHSCLLACTWNDWQLVSHPFCLWLVVFAGGGSCKSNLRHKTEPDWFFPPHMSLLKYKCQVIVSVLTNSIFKSQTPPLKQMEFPEVSGRNRLFKFFARLVRKCLSWIGNSLSGSQHTYNIYSDTEGV